MAEALKYLHESKGIAHFDIKKQNILWNATERTVTLIDFDRAMIFDQREPRISAYKVGSPYHICPEFLRKDTGPIFGPEADVFSLGVTLFSMLTDDFPLRPTKKPHLTSRPPCHHTLARLLSSYS